MTLHSLSYFLAVLSRRYQFKPLHIHILFALHGELDLFNRLNQCIVRYLRREERHVA